MGLPHDPEYDDYSHSLHSTVNDNVPDDQTFVLQLPPTTEVLDDNQEDVDYLSMAAGHAAVTHTNTVRSVPTNLIDRVLASPEQTYEQLLASFTYLTAGLYNLLICD